ncbi:hypothetical protein K1719_007576 [Acacia pycnantha]|nr:hypothetical protein K1719_007576 [Acacia pycnantha]
MFILSEDASGAFVTTYPQSPGRIRLKIFPVSLLFNRLQRSELSKEDKEAPLMELGSLVLVSGSWKYG